MNMRIFIIMLLLLAGNVMYGQEQKELIEIRGKVMSSKDKTPVKGALISAEYAQETVTSDSLGDFVLHLTAMPRILTVKSSDFKTESYQLLNRQQVSVYLTPQSTRGYVDKLNLPFQEKDSEDKTGSSVSLSVRDMGRGLNFADEALVGNIAGLRTLQKGGMPGEGNFVSFRGTRSFTGSNTPLIVVDGMPVMPELTPSSVFTGYSRNIFNRISFKEVDNITAVKGFDAMVFGSVGSNGVIMINTDRASDMETKVEFETMNGVATLAKKLPLLEAGDYRSYLVRNAQTGYESDAVYSMFPFLLDNPLLGEGYYAYQHNTDWQEEIFSPAFSTENILKVKGGDAVAKYSILAGYMQMAGIEDNSKTSRYYARFNGDMKMNQKLSMFTNVGFSYFDNQIHEQGMVSEINPLLTAIRKPSILGAKRVNKVGKQLDVWDPVREFQVSNPAGVVNEVKGEDFLYNIMINLGLTYDFTSDLRLKGSFGINYDYSRDKLFIPGMSTPSLMPMEGGKAENTIRNGIGKSMSYYGNLTLDYRHLFKNGHELNVLAGGQLLFLDKLYEYAKGINTATDYDRELSSVKNADGKYLDGYDDMWKWYNIFANVGYNYNKQFYAGLAVSADVTSVTGEKTDMFQVYPAANVAWKLNNSSFLREVDLISNLTLRGEYSLKGNAMLPAMISKYHYVVSDYKEMSGVVRGNIPNDKLKPEVVASANVGLDFAVLGNKLNLSADVYQDQTKDMILPENLSSAFGSKFRYVNSGEMKTKGLELSLSALLLSKGDFEWRAGGNIAFEKSEIVSLGDFNERITTLTDGAQIVSRVGESPYAFYGLESRGVYATSAEAVAGGLKDGRGMNYRGGDMHYLNLNDDQVIDQQDYTIIGDPTPDFYGAFFTSFRYKTWSLNAQFTYSYGNDIYNAVRRVGEGMTDFSGQTQAVKNSWNYEGHQTDVPKAEYGDPMHNSQFSSRWIEDGSFLKLKNLTVNYDYPRQLWVFTKLQVYLTGENLFTCTKYLGYDPEFSYSYDHQLLGVDYGKVPNARAFRLGIRLGF